VRIVAANRNARLTFISMARWVRLSLARDYLRSDGHVDVSRNGDRVDADFDCKGLGTRLK
jgi:hypothetical protein